MITRSPRRQSFTIVDNEILDSGLPLDTIGLFIYLLSKPDNWQVMVPHLMAKHGVGKNKVYRMLTELQEAGYASYERQATGHTDWIISETRIDTPHPQNSDEGKKPHPQKPDLAFPDQENRDVILTSTERTTNTEIAANTELRATKAQRTEAFKRFYETYPVKKGRMKAEESWLKVTNKMTVEDLDAFTADLIGHVQKMMQFDADWLRGAKPHPTTYLNQQRWLDEVTVPTNEPTEADKYELRQQRTAAIFQELNGSAVGHHVQALPPGVDEHEWGDWFEDIPRLD